MRATVATSGNSFGSPVHSSAMAVDAASSTSRSDAPSLTASIDAATRISEARKHWMSTSSFVAKWK